MAAGLDANKAKTARRVIEVLEFFDEESREATVMDIARRYNRPQSSTSELLAILVDMGLLYKDAGARVFRPTPRAAMLGSMFQPRLVRDGSLAMLTERLGAETGLGVLVAGRVGLSAQIFRWSPGEAAAPAGFCGGAQTPLQESAAGWLLLSTLPTDRREPVLRRLRAEAAPGAAFELADIRAQVQACAGRGLISGPGGFGGRAGVTAALLPADPGEHPLVLGLVYAQGTAEPEALEAVLEAALGESLAARREQVVDLEVYRARAQEAQLRRA
jgi:DNA-binding IclR family transcriptional regulator